MAQQRHGKMRHIWKSGHLHVRLKMRLHVTAVGSIMTYGAEAWLLNDETKRALNGANSKMVSNITGRTPHEEASKGKTYDVVAGVRAKRLKWLGQILQMGEERMLLQAAKMMYEDRREGDLLMDIPATESWQGLRDMATAEKGKVWRQLVRGIKDSVHIKAAKKTVATSSKKRKNGGKKRDAKKKQKAKTDEDEDDDGSDDGGWVIKRVVHKKVQPRVRCNDGFSVSIQASRDHCCTPRDDIGPYDGVEVTYPSEWEDLLLPFTDSGTPTICGEAPTLHVNVPASVVREMVKKHGGLARRSGKLPRMVEVDEDGYAWAEAAVPPTDTETETEDEEHETEDEEGEGEGISRGVEMGSPISPTVTMAMIGQISPPPALINATFSPIQTERLMIEDIKPTDE